MSSLSPADKSATTGPLPERRSPQLVAKLLLLLSSIFFSVVLFLTIDWVRTSHQLQPLVINEENAGCRVADPVRHHSLKPNCQATAHWGRDSYPFTTNSLGFRDQTVREVPISDPRPRILILGDSFTQGKLRWSDSYVGKIAAHFPQYDFLNGSVDSYSPSNYLNVARMVMSKGIDFDEVIVFIDISDVQDEAAFYHDVDASGAVAGPKTTLWNIPTAAKWQWLIARHLASTYYILEWFQRHAAGAGQYHLTTVYGDTFDLERSAWTYRKVNQKDPYIDGYAPLGVEGGIAKEEAKMTELWQELQKRNIPISVVVYPWPAQVVHDTADSRQVQIWRDWCQGRCKRFISLFPDFIALKEHCPSNQPGCWYLSYFIFGDVHYNAAGNAVVADRVIKSMTEVPPTKRTGSQLASKQEQP